MLLKTLLHRQIWQRLPRTWRRAALFRMTRALAPRPNPAAKGAFPIVVAGALRTASGLGQSARLCHDALKAAGVPVFGIDLTASLMQAEDVPDFAFEDARSLKGAGTLIVHVNAPLMPLAMTQIGQQVIAEKRVVGYWAWELSEMPDEWRHGVPFVHEIWAPSTFTADALRTIAADKPVRIVPPPVALHARPNTSPLAKSGDRAFTVLSIFNAASSIARKNPVAALTAFQLAFGDDPNARLILKASNGEVNPQGMEPLRQAAKAAHNITLIEDTMSAVEIDVLYAQSDVLISLHRSEGFGLTIAEAMLHGVPSIATNWSSNLDFLTDKTGVPISYTLVPARDSQGTYDHPKMLWADANIVEAAAALKHFRDNPSHGRALGEAARSFAQTTWSVPAYAASVCNLLGIEQPRQSAQ